jgi:hypothetical protein
MSPLAAPPTSLAGQEQAATKLTVGGGYVYWIHGDDSSLRRVPVAGGAVEKVATAVHACVADGGDVYCAAKPSTGTGGDVLVRLRGTDATVLGSAVLTGEASTLVVHGDELYGVASRLRDPAVVFAVPKSGGPLRTLSVHAKPVGSEPGPLAVDDTHVYYAPGTIQRVPRGGGPAETVHPGVEPNPPLSLALGKDHVVFVARPRGANPYVAWATVLSVPKAGGAAREIARPPQHDNMASGPMPNAVVVVGDRAWFSTNEGGLWWVPVDGSGSPVQRAGKLRESIPPSGATIRSGSIVWSDGRFFWNTELGSILASAP